MWFLTVGVISLGLGILAVVGLLAVARELMVERPFEADSMNDGGTKGKSESGRASRRRCAMTR